MKRYLILAFYLFLTGIEISACIVAADRLTFISWFQWPGWLYGLLAVYFGYFAWREWRKQVAA